MTFWPVLGEQMHRCPFLKFICLVLVIPNFISAISQAETLPCDWELAPPLAPVTLSVVREAGVARAQALNIPPVSFELPQARIPELPAEPIVPLAFQSGLSRDRGFVAIPSPVSPDPATIGLTVEDWSFPQTLTVPWRGQEQTTTVFVTAPLNHLRANSEKLIGPQYPRALVYLHGGGTQSASAKNAVSVGEGLAADGIPMVAIDKPGHGQSTRSAEGLTEPDALADWLLQVVDQLIDENVQVVLAGHSWGAEFVAYMHRKAAVDPRFARFIHFVALAPPADVSQGGDERLKLEHEKWFEQNYVTLKERMAPDDFEFLQNILDNGKYNWAGMVFTTLSNLDFKLPELSAEQWSKMRPLTVVMGENDGLCYVGREQAFHANYANICAPSELIMLAPGVTWKSNGKPRMTGHQLHDLYIDGTTNRKVMSLFRDIMTRDLPFPYQNPIPLPEVKSDDPVVRAANLERRVWTLLDESYRSYANFPAYRAYFLGHAEYVEVATADNKDMLDKLKRLIPYNESVNRVLNQRGELEKRVSAALATNLRAKVGVNTKTNLERARLELTWPAELTPARKIELESYLEKVRAVEEALSQDPVLRNLLHDQQTKRQQKFGAILAGLGLDESNFTTKLEELKAMSTRAKGQDAETRANLAKLEQAIAQDLQSYRRAYNQTRDAHVDAIELPSGVASSVHAEFELEADYSLARRASLQAFVDQYEVEVVQATPRQVEESLQRQLAELSLPEGFTSLDEARADFTRLSELASMRYIPTDENHVESNNRIRALVARRIEMDQKRDLLRLGDNSQQGNAALSLDRHRQFVQQLRNKRNRQLSHWDSLWVVPENSETTAVEGMRLTSPAVEARLRTFNEARAHWYQIYGEVNEQLGQWIYDLRANGTISGASLLQVPLKLRQTMQRFAAARERFHRHREVLENLRRREALHSASRLTGDPKQIELARSLARELWGEEYLSTNRPAPQSLVQRVSEEEESFEARLREVSRLEREGSRLLYFYSQELVARGIRLPSVVNSVNIAELFNVPLEELATKLQRDRVAYDALVQFHNRWKSQMLLELRFNSETNGQ